MSGLTSMLVPLQQTLEGWPDARVPSVPEQLAIYMGVPALLTLAIVVYVLITRKREQRYITGAGAAVEPAWLGGGETSAPVLESGVEPATSNKTAALRAGTQDEPTGGASGRW